MWQNGNGQPYAYTGLLVCVVLRQRIAIIKDRRTVAAAAAAAAAGSFYLEVVDVKRKHHRSAASPFPSMAATTPAQMLVFPSTGAEEPHDETT